jgi:hypothetical protein
METTRALLPLAVIAGGGGDGYLRPARDQHGVGGGVRQDAAAFGCGGRLVCAGTVPRAVLARQRALAIVLHLSVGSAV